MELKNLVKDHVEWRHQIFKLAKSDLIKTYSGAALGWAWAIIKPSVTIFVYWFAFSIGLRHRGDIYGFPFFLWLIAGMVPWFYIQEMLTQGTTCMRRYKHLITKMKFPVSTIPTFVGMSKFVIHLLLFAIVIVIYFLFGEPFTLYYLQLPIYMLLMFLFCVGWTLFGSVLAAISQDFANLVKSFTTALFWLSGIMWPVNKITNHVGRMLLKMNPITFTCEGYRNCLIHKVWIWQEPKELAVYLIEIVIMWALALWAFKKLKKDMPDVL